MTDNHKSKQEGVGAFRGGRNENHNDRYLTSSNNRISGGSTPLPPLTPPFQQNSVETQHLIQQQKEMKTQSASPLSPTWWQEPANVKENNNAADKFSPERKEPVTKSLVDTAYLPSEQGLQELCEDFSDDFCLYDYGADDQMDLYLTAPLTPKSLSNSPIMPTGPRPPLLYSFDSDEETTYDTTGFFPSLSSIERRQIE